jgi:hypothetical protein
MVAINTATSLMLLLWFLNGAQGRSNIIIVQPDDLPFLDEWTAPPNEQSPPMP